MEKSLLVPLVGVVLAAVIAGVISLVVAILAKDQKISEFRLAWIESLRNDVADLIGICQAVIDLAEDAESGEAILSQRHDEFVRMEILINRVKLRLNSEEHNGILEVLNRLHKDNDDSLSDIEEQLPKLVDQVRLVLNSEWGRVKQGEFSFRALKWVSACVVIASVFGAIYWKETIALTFSG